MSEQVLTREAVEAPTFNRESDGSLRVTTLMVPWRSPAEVIGCDRDGNQFWYTEQFEPGAFDRNAAPEVVHRVRLVWGHNNDFPNQLGRAVQIRNDDAGAVGVFRVPRSLAERAREELDGQAVSVSFLPITPRMFEEQPRQLMTRTAAHLIHLGVVDAPAYDGARVLETRAGTELKVAELQADEAQRDAADAAVAARRAAGDTLAASLELARSWRALSAEEEAFLAAHAAVLADSAPPA